MKVVEARRAVPTLETMARQCRLGISRQGSGIVSLNKEEKLMYSSRTTGEEGIYGGDGCVDSWQHVNRRNRQTLLHAPRALVFFGSVDAPTKDTISPYIIRDGRHLGFAALHRHIFNPAFLLD